MKGNGERSWFYIGLILMQSVVYGIGNPLTKVAYESITPFWLLAFRFSLAFGLFMLFFGKRTIVQLKTVKPQDILPASLCMALAYILCNVALSMTSATNVAFMMALAVVIAPILSVFVLKKKYLLHHLPVQLLVLVGVFLLCGGGQISVNKGDLLSLAMAFFLAGSLVYGEKSLKHLDAVAVSTAQSGVTAIISLICALVFDDAQVIPGIQPGAWLIVVYLAIFCTCLAYLFQNLALLHLQAQAVSMLQCTQPILTAVVAFFMLGEALSPISLVGAGIILLCTITENLLQKKEQGIKPIL